jgi:ornithine decarboxylase
MRPFLEPQKNSIINLLNHLRPDTPLYVYRIKNLIKAVNFFLKNFKGETLYAVKANPDPLIIKYLYQLGITKYDVASLNEIIHVKTLIPQAEIYFMHPIKSRESIKKAYYEYGVRHFSLDTAEELYKIIKETGNAKDIKLHVRFAVSNPYSTHQLSHKFGADINEAAALLIECRQFTKALGLCFHVGTQCMNTKAYRKGIYLAKKIIKTARVDIQTLDVGGGFPSCYCDISPPPLISYFNEIYERFEYYKFNCRLLCEPGRALVAESGALITRVALRKGNFLYLNDGLFGNLFDCSGILGYLFPTKLIRYPALSTSTQMLPFSFFGPTCDSLDFMKGPFMLPADIKEGDYIEIGQVGAYGATLATRFNGFGNLHSQAFTDDPPIIASMYD